MTATTLITGAASGIGAATIIKYLDDTCMHIIAVDINGASLDAMKQQLSEEQQSRLTTLALDLTDQQAVQDNLLSEVIARGGIDHLVISHAVGFDNQISENDKWDTILNVNLIATQRLFSLVDEHVKDDGRVVVLSSILGRVGKVSNSGYVTSKHALLGLVKALALDWAYRKITVNAILPCWVDTEMLRDQLAPQAALVGSTVKKMLRKIKKGIPLRSLIAAEDVADCVLFLTSSKAKMITAQSIVIDGGFSCGA